MAQFLRWALAEDTDKQIVAWASEWTVTKVMIELQKLYNKLEIALNKSYCNKKKSYHKVN